MHDHTTQITVDTALVFTTVLGAILFLILCVAIPFGWDVWRNRRSKKDGRKSNTGYNIGPKP